MPRLLLALSLAMPAAAQTTLPVKGSDGATYTVRAPNADGRAAAAASAPVVLSTEDQATLNGLFKAGQSIGNVADTYSVGNTLSVTTVGNAFAWSPGNQAQTRVQIAGLTASGATLALQYNVDGSTWAAVNEIAPSSGTGLLQNQITADGAYSFMSSARYQMRLVVTVAGTGSVTVAIDRSVTPNMVRALTGDCADEALGCRADPAYTSGTATLIAIAKAIDRDTLLPLAAQSGNVWIGNVGLQSGATLTLATGSNVIGGVTQSGAPWSENITQLGGTAIATGTGVTTPGTLRTTLSTDIGLPAGTNTLGSVKITDGTNVPAVKAASTAPVATDPAFVVVISPNTPTLPVSMTATALNASSGAGLSNYHTLISAATTNATSVKTTSGSICFIDVYNTSAAVKFFKLFNKASAPTVGTDTPVYIFAIPPGGRLSLSLTIAIRMTTGIAYAITGAASALDTTAVAAGDVIVNLGYA